MKELNDKRMKARAAFRLALHYVPDGIEKDLAWEAAEEYMKAEHKLIEAFKRNAAALQSSSIKELI